MRSAKNSFLLFFRIPAQKIAHSCHKFMENPTCIFFVYRIKFIVYWHFVGVYSPVTIVFKPERMR